jgi:hypothetical protein
LIILTICRYSIADAILNNLIRTITYDTVRGIISEGIAHITLSTDQCAGIGGTYLILQTIWSRVKAGTVLNDLIRTITCDTVRGTINEGIVGITLSTQQCGGVCGIHLILYTICRCSIADAIHNNLARVITLGTVCGIVSEGIAHITLCTKDCGGGGIQLILLTIWRCSIASTIQNSLSRGITLDTTCSIVNKCIVGITKGTNRCGGVCGTHLIYLTVWSSAVASTIQNSLVRGIT